MCGYVTLISICLMGEWSYSLGPSSWATSVCYVVFFTVAGVFLLPGG